MLKCVTKYTPNLNRRAETSETISGGWKRASLTCSWRYKVHYLTAALLFSVWRSGVWTRWVISQGNYENVITAICAESFWIIALLSCESSIFAVLSSIDSFNVSRSVVGRRWLDNVFVLKEALQRLHATVFNGVINTGNVATVYWNTCQGVCVCVCVCVCVYLCALRFSCSEVALQRRWSSFEVELQ